jgi:hypothetical protein
MGGVKNLDPVMLSRFIDDPVMMQGHRKNPVELGWDPILYARSGGKGPPSKREGLIGVVGNKNPPGILKVKTHTPKSRISKGNGGMDDSSLETVGIYERESDSPLNDIPTPRRVTWDAKIKDKRGCSIYGGDGIFEDIIDTISKMKILSKLDSGANRLRGGLEGLGMKCAGKFTPCANNVCGHKAKNDVEEENDLKTDVDEENDLIDCDDYGKTSRLHDEVVRPIENDSAYHGEFAGASRDAIRKEFNFNTFSRRKTESDIGETIGIMSKRNSTASSSLRNYQRFPRRYFPSESPLNAAAVVQYRMKQLPLSPIVRTRPGEKRSRGQRHSSHHAIKPTRTTLSPIYNGKNKTEFSRIIINGLKKPIKLMSNGITSNHKQSSYPKRILTITTDY